MGGMGWDGGWEARIAYSSLTNNSTSTYRNKVYATKGSTLSIKENLKHTQRVS